MRYLLFLLFPISTLAQIQEPTEALLYRSDRDPLTVKRITPGKTDTVNLLNQIPLPDGPPHGIYSITMTLLDSGATVPPDTIPPCACTDGKDGIDGVPGPAGPQGEKGETGAQGPPGPSGGGTSILRPVFWLSDYAKGDGVTDDTQGIQSAINATITARGFLVIPDAPNFYKFTNTLYVLPLSGEQVRLDIWAWGDAGNLRYMGPSGTASQYKPLIFTAGLKESEWHGLKITVNQGVAYYAVLDIDTTPQQGSTSFDTFKNFRIILSDREGVAVRIGHRSGDGVSGKDDISNLIFRQMTLNGGRSGRNPIPGQYGYVFEGPNTLSNTIDNGFIAYMDISVSNVSIPGTGARSDRGNSSINVLNLGGAQNNLEFEYGGYEGVYSIKGGRWETGKRFLHVKKHHINSQITIENTQIRNYAPQNGEPLIYMGTAGELVLDALSIDADYQALREGFPNLIVLDGDGNAGTLDIRGGAAETPTDQLYKKQGTTNWKVRIKNVRRYGPEPVVNGQGTYRGVSAPTHYTNVDL